MSSAAPTPNPDRPRIFGIGLNKTGTTTFGEALTILGFTSLHFGGDDAHRAVQRAIDEGVPLVTYLDPVYDAFSDIGLLSRRFKMLDQQYPGSRFVLTTRPRADWIDSRRRHVERNLKKQARGEYDGTFLVVDEEKWIDEWEHHHERVRAHFGNRPDFLEIDLSDEPSWTPLCSFLGVAEPAEPFPWANRGADRSRGPASRLLSRFTRS
jgi:hypothetical protein